MTENKEAGLCEMDKLLSKLEDIEARQSQATKRTGNILGRLAGSIKEEENDINPSREMPHMERFMLLLDKMVLNMEIVHKHLDTLDNII